MSSEKSLIHSKFEAIRRKNNKEHGHFCLTLGALYKEKGLLEKAFQEFSEYTNICQNNQHDRLELAKVLREMGEIKVELKEYREGLSLINRYHDTAKALGDVLEVQRALTTLGRAHFIQGLDTESEIQKCRRFEKADEYNERAFDAIPKANSDKCTNLER
jgi:tetratricopeptide (TPR) repeat protein